MPISKQPPLSLNEILHRQGDLSLPSDHPKRVLIDRILELEVRLSYFDRIKDTLPAPYKESLPLFQGEAPLPNFEFDNKGSLLTILLRVALYYRLSD